MMILTLTNCPPSLRGDLTKWLQEINTGVYVGQVSVRVRDEIWKRVLDNVKSGKATMVFDAGNEQRMDFRVHNSEWEPIDFDGLKLMLRPSPARIQKLSELRKGFSNAAKRHMGRRMLPRGHAEDSLPRRYVVVDLETTGLSALEDEIIEIGALLVSEREVVGQYQALVRSGARIPPSVRELTGLCDEILQSEGRDIVEVLPEFLAFSGALPVVSHNADFDYGFLRAACRLCAVPLFSNQCVDTLTLAHRLVEDVRDYKLATLLEFFGIKPEGAHRSMDDCMSTMLLYEKLIEIRQKEG